jgi:outer membrane scaffolding protein for murein synthesis (MipA/OmpV family)
MLYSSLKKRSLIAILTIAFSSFAFSADIARTLRTNSQDNNDPDNFLEVGLGAGAFIGSSLKDADGKAAGLGVNLSASYNWKGFFIDVFAETGEPIIIGYNAYNNDVWSFDVVLGTTGEGVSEDTDNRFIGLNERESSSMLGGRLTGYFGENILQVSLKHDVKGRSKGTVASALLGRNWQYRNWNFHGLVGLYLSDAKFNDYYLGVTAEESAITGLEVYDGKTSVTFNSSLGVTYPISENWIYRATVSFGSDFGKKDSSLFEKKRSFYTGISNSISYVF